MYHIFFIHSSVDGHLGCFHDLAIVNSAAMNIGVHVSVGIMVFSRYMPRCGIARSYGISMFSFLRSFHTVLHSGCNQLNWYSYCGKQYGGFSKKLKIELPSSPAIPLLGIYPKKPKIELPYGSAIPLLGMYPEKTIIQKDTCTPVFLVTLFTVARSWKPSKCLSTDKWIKKM